MLLLSSMTSKPEYLERIFESNVSDAGFLQQMAVLGLASVHYEGKMVLDIGSGLTNRFAREAPEYVDNSTIISINPLLAYEDQCEKHGIDKSSHGLGVAALAQGLLPFRDEAFDTVVSVLGVPNALKSEEIPPLYNDVWRILKPGGVASFWPHAHMSTGAQVMVDFEYMSAEELDPRILELLPEPYRDCKNRVQITKPAFEKDLPKIIASIE